MNILPFAGVAAVALLKNRMGSLSRSNYGGYDRNLIVTPDLIRRTGIVMSKLKQLNSIDIGHHKIINLTPHPVDITLKDGTDIEIPRSGGYIRIKLFNSKEEAYGFDNIDVRYPDNYNLNIHFRGHNVSGGESYGLFPTPELLAKDPYFNNVWFLVSRISSHYMNEYLNLLTVGETGLGSREPQKFLSIAEDLCLDKKTGSRSLTDILFLAETRGGKDYYKIHRILNPDSSEKFKRNMSLGQIVSGMIASSGGGIDTAGKSDRQLYFELTGTDWDSLFGRWKLETADGSGFGGYDVDEMKYIAQKEIFDGSTFWDGRTYYIVMKPEDMFDPIEEDGFALEGRDAVMNIQELYKQRDFIVGKYGNRDRIRRLRAIENLENLGYQNFNDIITSAANHQAPRQDYNRIKSHHTFRNMKIDDSTIHLVHFIEEVWKKIWTVDARKDARARTKKLRK